MEYTAVIRTLGKGGKKYQETLDSLCRQTIPPTDIIVYIAEGYDIPLETCGRERYVFVKKGMVAQRALPYVEVATEFILFLDDDVYLPVDGCEKLFSAMSKNGADVIAPNTFEHISHGKTNLLNILLRKAVPFTSDTWAYMILPSGGYRYNSKPDKDFYWSQSNAGPCFLCRKNDFLSIHFEEELWLDETPYALPEDQVMFYKMYRYGLKVGTLFNSGIVHLDAGSTIGFDSDREQKLLYSEVRNTIIFWHKFIASYNKGIKRLWPVICINHYKNMRRLLALKNMIAGDFHNYKIVSKAIADARDCIKERL